MKILQGKQRRPRRVMLYGTHGIGKSTWAAGAPRPVFVQTERGLDDIGPPRFPLARTWADVMQALAELYSAPHDFGTLALDTLDWTERLIWADVCESHKVANIEEIGYGKGYVYASTRWRDLLEGLEAIRRDKKMTIILLAHATVAKFENPETDNYDRYAPCLHKLAAAMVQQWCDEVLFATYRVYVKQTKEGFDKKTTKGLGTGERIIHTVERPAWQAKNRLGLPDDLPLPRENGWAEYAKYLPSAPEAPPA